VDAAKEAVYARLKVMEPGPSFCHFPTGRDRDYFDMLTAEVRVPDYTGSVPKYQWKKKTAGARNEALDARCYAYAALIGLMSGTALRLNREAERVIELSKAAGGKVQAPPPPAQRVTSSDWMRGLLG